ncbi:MAG TPA: polysaccharide pyruvyl transferase family protein, partial [Allocoleopsis sp.]
ANTNLIDIGPEEWLGYYSQASYIFTSFYHGLIFSIIFRKPFTAFIRSLKGDDKSSKVNDLLKDLNLENRSLRIDEIPDAPKKLNFEIDFNDEKLNQMIHASKTYLAKVLSNNNEHTKINISYVLASNRSNDLTHSLSLPDNQ